MDRMGKMIFMSPARKAHIHLRQVEHQLRSDKKVNSEIHAHTQKNRSSIHQTCSFSPWVLTVIREGKRGPLPSWEGAR